MKLHRRIAGWLGYDLQKHNKQMTLPTHLTAQLRTLNVDLVLDIGANTGQFGRLLRDEVGFGGDILSIEPHPEAYAQLELASKHDDRWQCIAGALGEKNTTASLGLSPRSAFSSLQTINTIGRARFGPKSVPDTFESVRVFRLAELLRDVIPDIAQRRVFMKVDAQGHDLSIVKGAEPLLHSFAGLLVEVAVIPVYENTPSYLETIAYLEARDFGLSGVYPLTRVRESGHILEMDCVFTAFPD